LQQPNIPAMTSKYLFLAFISVAFYSCTYQEEKKASSENTGEPMMKVDTAHAKFIISMLNLGDYQAQLAGVIVFKSHNQEVIEAARAISKNNLRIKDKAKVAAIPRNIKTPYFLTHEQNDQVTALKQVPDSHLNKKFVEIIRENQDMMQQLCSKEALTSPADSDLVKLCDFSKSIIEENSTLLKSISTE
jgi:hypothetical protein